MRMGLSVLAVALYTALSAPDVALAEAMVGALLTTFVYVLLLRTPGTLRVGYVPVRMLFEEHPYGFDGLEYEIVKLFASKHGYKLEFVKAESVDELKTLLKEKLIDLACGPIVEDRGIIETVVLKLDDGKEIDILSAGSVDPSRVVSRRRTMYTILSDSEGFDAFLEEIRESGTLERLINKYAGARV